MRVAGGGHILSPVRCLVSHTLSHNQRRSDNLTFVLSPTPPSPPNFPRVHFITFASSTSRDVIIGDDYEFHVENLGGGRLRAVFLQPLPRGTVKFEEVLHESAPAVVVSCRSAPKSGTYGEVAVVNADGTLGESLRFEMKELVTNCYRPPSFNLAEPKLSPGEIF